MYPGVCAQRIGSGLVTSGAKKGMSMFRLAMQSAGLVIAAAAIILCSCGMYVRRYEQAGLRITGGRLSLAELGVNFGGMHATSSGTAISRVKVQVGVDRSNPPDGKLTDPPDLIVLNVDNSNASNEMTIAGANISTNTPQNVIAHFEIYQGNPNIPVYSETWHSGEAPTFL